MPRTVQDIIDHADELAARAENAEPNPGGGHPEAVAVLRGAIIDRAQAEEDLVSAVRNAHEDGLSWSAIGALVGTSPQAVRERYGLEYVVRREGEGDPEFLSATGTWGTIATAEWFPTRSLAAKADLPDGQGAGRPVGMAYPERTPA